MNLGRLFLLAFGVLFVSCGVVAVVSTTEEPATHFAAHEFALLRAEYESHRNQGVARRAAVFRRLQDSLATTAITPGLAQSVAEFCSEVAVARDEHGEVKAEARLAAQALRARTAPSPAAFDRLPAGVERVPAAVSR